jgi:hypothetical protein
MVSEQLSCLIRYKSFMFLGVVSKNLIVSLHPHVMLLHASSLAPRASQVRSVDQITAQVGLFSFYFLAQIDPTQSQPFFFLAKCKP